jgi:hypothetical protein
MPVIRDIQSSGIKSLRGELAARGIPTARGGAWEGRAESSCDSRKAHRPRRRFPGASENTKKFKRIIVIFQWTDSAIFVH